MAVSKMDFQCLLAFVLFAAFTCTLSFAYDPSPLQDICVAINDPNSAVLVNGKFCKDPKLVTADDFLFKGLNIPGNTANPVGSKVTPVFVGQLPGLNTLDVAFARLDYAPYGLNPPHTHPRASELLTVLEGSLLVGFVTSDPEYKLVSKVLYKGDAFVFPIGLIHFQQNVGNTNAVALAGFGSQNPGLIIVGNAIFGSKPPISDDILAKALQVDKKVIDQIQAKFAPPK